MRRYTAFTFGVTQWRTQFRQRMNKRRDQGEVRTCYEAGPTGYCLHWRLT
jgi:hypothetical protein